ncbi:hypothetical protein PQQ81_08735 [Paraburkholderia strydomiana]|uniref:hypothetical protein n=1 Tax=Paraburkholderia strydomiana TaxID=1245417 RepID=UPI0038BBCC3E
MPEIATFAEQGYRRSANSRRWVSESAAVECLGRVSETILEVTKQGEIVRKLGLVLLTAVLAPTAFGAGKYSEVWNPPEARATAPHTVTALHKLAVRRHVALHPRKVYSRRTSAPAPRLVAKKGSLPKTSPKDDPDMSQIPRQVTPEGNVLRVRGHALSAHVVR